MLDAWIIEERRKDRRAPGYAGVRLPFLQLPLHPEPPPEREHDADAEEDEPRSRVIVIDMV